MSIDSNLIGDNIRKFRKASGLTQAQLAKKCGMATGTIQQYELGKREPRIQQQYKICRALNIDPVALISGQTDADYNENFLEGMRGFLEVLTIADGDPDKAKQIFVNKETLLLNFFQLNLSGQKKAIDQVEMLTKIPEYQAEVPDENE